MNSDEIAKDLKNCPESVREYVQKLKESNRRKSELLNVAGTVVLGFLKERKATTADEDKAELKNKKP